MSNPSSAPAISSSAPLIGRTLANKYTIEGVVGTGAMGTIYRARQIALDKWVAVKVLHQALAEDPSFVDRFKIEAFSASRLEHPNSLRVIDFGKDDGLLYLVMEYVEAENLLSLMQTEWPFDDVRVAQIVSQALAALAKAHDVGIIHRDLKPENILVLRSTDDEGTPIDIVKVCDFGIAKLAMPMEDSHPFAPHATTEGLVVGTPDYMSPEQARGEDVDGRSDLYSMGVVLYHLLAGKTPFDGDTPFNIAIKHVSDNPVPPSAIRDSVHRGLEAVCLRAMNKRPEDRFPTARDMRRAVLAAVAREAQAVLAPLPIPTPTEAMQPIHPRPRFVSSTPPAELDITESGRIAGPVRPAVSRLRRASLAVIALLGCAAAASAVIAQRSDAFQSREVLSTTVALAPAAQGRPIEAPANPIAKAVPPTASNPAAPLAPTGHVSPVAQPAPVKVSDPRARRNSQPSAPARRTESAAPAALATPSAAAEPETTTPVVEAPAPAVVETTAPPPAPSPRVQSPVAEAPAAPLPTAVDPSRASVTIGNITTSSGISGTKVRTAIAHAPFTNCYREALSRRSSPIALQSVLKIEIDLAGRVVSAQLSDDGNLPGLRACIEAAARGAKVRDVDTGDGSATINLTLSPQ